MEDKKKICPICPNHCTEDAPGCEKGNSYFTGGAESERQHHVSHSFGGHSKHGGHGHHPHHGAQFTDYALLDSLTGLMMECGQYLFRSLHHGSGTKDEFFKCLNDSEQAELKKLLTKLLAAWNKQ